MTKQQIKNIINAKKSALSAKGIAAFSQVDADSADLRNIEQACWEMEEAGELVAFDRREENQGLFFAAA